MDTTVHQIKSRSAALGLRNLDIIRLLNDRGITTNPAQYSSFISGYTRSPKALTVTSAVNEILTELEEKEK